MFGVLLINDVQQMAMHQELRLEIHGYPKSCKVPDVVFQGGHVPCQEFVLAMVYPMPQSH